MKYPKLKIDEDVNMAKHTSFKAGGNAAVMITAENKEELKAILNTLASAGLPHMMLGNGSNTLFRDSGYDGVVVKLGEGFAKVSFDGNKATCGCAILMSVLSKEFLAKSLSGFEFAAGIPGSLGGAVFMNAGAYGGQMKDIIKEVRALSPDGKKEKVFSAEEMEFGYRHSVLEENGYIAVETIIELAKGDKEQIQERMRELAFQRSSKQPLQYPSAGSTFKRPEGYFAGKLIEDAGLKGLSVGGAQVSTLHSGFVINKDGATATDILDLMSLVQNTVYDKFGVMLEPEVRIIG